MKKLILSFSLLALCLPMLHAQNAVQEITAETELSLVEETPAEETDSVAPKGRYMLIPDDLVGDVEDVLSGRSKIVRDEDIVDFDEKVIVDGDTVNLIQRELNLGRYNRGLFNYLFIPRKSWQFAVTASYGEFSTEDLQLLDLLSDFDFNGHTFSIKPAISYFFRNNMSLGLRFGYTSSKANLGSFALDVDEDINFAIKDVGYRATSFTGALVFRQYIGLTRKGRFGVFNGIELSYTGGTSEFNRIYNEKPKLTETRSSEVRLSFSPGVCVFVMKNVSFNVAFGVMGFYLHNERQKVDGVDLGNRFTTGANFKFNILSIDFGIAVNI